MEKYGKNYSLIWKTEQLPYSLTWQVAWQYGILPNRLTVFRTSNFEIRNTTRQLGSVSDHTAAIPNLTGAILDLTGAIQDLTIGIPDLKMAKMLRSGTLPSDLAALRTSHFSHN